MNDFFNKEFLLTHIIKPSFPCANNVEIKNNVFDDDGLHFTSHVVHLTVNYEQDEKQCQKNLVLKIAKDDAAYLFFAKFDFYYKEKVMYEVMIPLINDILDTRIGPTHYYTADPGIFVLDDLTQQGYKCEEQHFISVERSLFVLQALAKFHAASYKLHQVNPDFLSDSAFYRSITIDSRSTLVGKWEPIIGEMMKQKNPAYVHLIPRFAAIVAYLQREDIELNSTCINNRNFKFVVLNHGDCRKDNVMFKYNFERDMQDVRLIDFQNCFWGSPVLDVFCYLIFCIDVSALESHFNWLLEQYLQCLNETLIKLQCDYHYYGKSNFWADFAQSHSYVILLLIGQFVLSCPLKCVESEDTLFFEDGAIVDFKCLDNEPFRKTLSGWLDFFEKLGIFQLPENV